MINMTSDLKVKCTCCGGPCTAHDKLVADGIPREDWPEDEAIGCWGCCISSCRGCGSTGYVLAMDKLKWLRADEAKILDKLNVIQTKIKDLESKIESNKNE